MGMKIVPRFHVAVKGKNGHRRCGNCDETSPMPSIYVSYSRSDAPSTVWRVVELLVEHYGDRAVQGSPPSGTDIEEDVAQSALVVAVIGPRWATLTGHDLDLVSRELEA